MYPKITRARKSVQAFPAPGGVREHKQARGAGPEQVGQVKGDEEQQQ